MKLSEYISTFPSNIARAQEKRRIAAALAVSESYIRGMFNGNFPVPMRLAMRLEKLTDGKVTMKETCPHGAKVIADFLQTRKECR